MCRQREMRRCMPSSANRTQRQVFAMPNATRPCIAASPGAPKPKRVAVAVSLAPVHPTKSATNKPQGNIKMSSRPHTDPPTWYGQVDPQLSDGLQAHGWRGLAWSTQVPGRTYAPFR